MQELIEMALKERRPDYDEGDLKTCMNSIYAPRFERLRGRIRPMTEVLDNFFGVLSTPSLSQLDGVDSIVKDSLNTLCRAKGLSANEKRMYLNQLLMKFEVFLKKLYYLINGRELTDRDPSRNATLSSAIFGIPSLKALKHSHNPAEREFSERLDILRQLRNDEAHGSADVSEQEIDRAISIVTDMYLYAVGTNITELEMSHHDYETSRNDARSGLQVSPRRYASYDEASSSLDGSHGYGLSLAAENVDNVAEWPEPTRLELLRECLTRLINHGYAGRSTAFSKLRHWEAVYRIAADYGFVIDGDYRYFNQVIANMDIQNLPYPLPQAFLENANVGIYAQSFKDWTDEDLSGKALAEYNDIRKCALIFERIIKNKLEKLKGHGR